VIIEDTMFATQPVYNAAQAVHTLRSDQNKLDVVNEQERAIWPAGQKPTRFIVERLLL
jgi:hypothetical protein